MQTKRVGLGAIGGVHKTTGIVRACGCLRVVEGDLGGRVKRGVHLDVVAAVVREDRRVHASAPRKTLRCAANQADAPEVAFDRLLAAEEVDETFAWIDGHDTIDRPGPGRELA